jgi:energy-coupling factor transport system substrate-specific component
VKWSVFLLDLNKKHMEQSKSLLPTVLIPLVGVGLNYGLAVLVLLLKVPIYLDAVGTIVITLLVGLRAGIITGVISFMLMTITGIGPYHIYFSGTQVVIALIIYLMASRSFFSTFPKVILTGIIVGICAAVASAPVIVYLFGGVEGNGPGLITSFLIATGKTISQSVLLKGISVEPIDKSIQCVFAFMLIKSLPNSQLQAFRGSLVYKNFMK